MCREHLRSLFASRESPPPRPPVPAWGWAALARSPLLRCGHDMLAYKRDVESIGTLGAFAGVEAGPRRDLLLALSANPSHRPAAAALLGVPFFTADVQVRMVRFLSRMLERNPVHKAQFLQMLGSRAPGSGWRALPARVLELHVLPRLFPAGASFCFFQPALHSTHGAEGVPLRTSAGLQPCGLRGGAEGSGAAQVVMHDAAKGPGPGAGAERSNGDFPAQSLWLL